MSASVSRSIALSQADELQKMASMAKRKADSCANFSDRLIELRRVRDLEKLAEEATRRG